MDYNIINNLRMINKTYLTCMMRLKNCGGIIINIYKQDISKWFLEDRGEKRRRIESLRLTKLRSSMTTPFNSL